MEFGLLLFVFFAIPFCVGAILGVLWRGGVSSLALGAGGLVLVCAGGWMVWQIQADPYRHMRDFHTFGGILDFFIWQALLPFGWVFWVCSVGGIPGALGGHFLKVWLRSRNVPPVLPANV